MKRNIVIDCTPPVPLQIVSVLVTIASTIIVFEVVPEESIWSIPVRQEYEHIIAVPASGGFSSLLTQKQGESSLDNKQLDKIQRNQE